MFRCAIFFLLFLPLSVFASDTTYAVKSRAEKLHGYKRLLYNIVLLHPKMDSPVEKDMLRHYLIGSGSLYKISDADFARLKESIPFYPQQKIADSSVQAPYKLVRVDLNDDAYFGLALGNIVSIIQASTGEILSFADIYDFNKSKKGKRTLKNEIITRTFRLLSPSSVKAFIVTYNADGYIMRTN